MRYLVTAQEMKQYDKNTIEYLGIPGPVLMERAALAAEDFLKERFDAVKERTKVLIFAGMGNNGGDGLALARLLAADGYTVAVRLVGDPEKATEQWKSQWQTLQHFPVKTDSNTQADEYNVIVDALFGVGLSRPVEGIYAEAVEEMNVAEGFKLALDVPSGICSDTGRVLGCAFLADATITFGFCKRGLVMYPGTIMPGRYTLQMWGSDRRAFWDRARRCILMTAVNSICRTEHPPGIREPSAKLCWWLGATAWPEQQSWRQERRIVPEPVW